ncbi:PTS transporter subunit IIC [Weissella paramesenteroides]|uniref:PTS transporter subunit IIC n=1 Tax=Weissella paramesenteroides TaxID=1249 RepID=UPI00223A74FE|nr:PTS sugar transporter subunit IIC [Weissella paramesenteroides]MCT0486233.1 PTS sugar transporter subunit IIC [Weissella paramesenteroides]
MVQGQEQEKKLTAKDYVFLVSQGVSNTVLVFLGIGLLVNTVGTTIHWDALVQVGNIAQKLLAPALGMAIAVMMRTSTLVIGATMIASTVGANSVYFTSDVATHTMTATGWVAAQDAGSQIMTSGQPVSAVLAGVIAAMLGKWMTGKTPLDMVLVPFAVTMVGSIAGLALASVTTPALNWVSGALGHTMQVNPVLGSLVVSFAWVVFLMTPASSAALAIAVQLDPMSSGAALIGTTVAFVSFTAMSYDQNTIGGNIAQGLVTPKVQFANLLKRPILAVGPAAIAMVTAVIAVVGFGFKVPYALAGLGLNSLIAPLWLAAHNMQGLILLIVFGVAIPAVLAWFYYRFLRVIGQTRVQDLRLREV